MSSIVRVLVPVLLLGLPVSLRLDDPTKGEGEQAAQGEGAPGPEQIVAGIDWLAGVWSGAMWDGEFVAHYSAPVGSKVLSYSQLLKDGEETFYEFEVFEARDGEVHLQPFPGGERAGSFTLVQHDDAARKLVFENPDKDFPTRIVYERPSEDRLVITLSDPHGDSEKVEVFDLKR